MNTPRIRPSGLAVVGYGMTLVGFVQVAVTIAPHVADRIPSAGAAAPLVGVAVALGADVVWAALGHTTIQVARTRRWGATAGFGGATALAVVASTVLLAAVGHMGPWSAIPALACLLLVADGVRSMVTVSDATASAIAGMAAEIRDERAMAQMEARRAAHHETIHGFREAARLAARTGALAEIRVSVAAAEAGAARALERSGRRHGAGVETYREIMGATVGTVGVGAVSRLAAVEDAEVPSGLVDLTDMTLPQREDTAAELYRQLASWDRVSTAMGKPKSTVRRWAQAAMDREAAS